jgi:hypothetical protein
MSRDELLDAYVGGDLGRRAFVHGLVALGVSIEVAVAHAVALKGAPGSTEGVDDVDADAGD